MLVMRALESSVFDRPIQRVVLVCKSDSRPSVWDIPRQRVASVISFVVTLSWLQF